MPTPVAAATALVGTRTGRRILIGILAAVAVVSAAAFTPLIAIPLVLAGSTTAVQTDAAEGPVPTAKGDWGYPFAGDYMKGRGFGHNPVRGCGYCSVDHQGYDMSQGCGSTVHAAGPGRVVTAGSWQGYGNTVRIDHGDGLITLYGHMQWGSLRVRVGEQVTAGTALGVEGNTGRSFGCHLHFEVQQHGASLDPQPFMAARGLPLT